MRASSADLKTELFYELGIVVPVCAYKLRGAVKDLLNDQKQPLTPLVKTSLRRAVSHLQAIERQIACAMHRSPGHVRADWRRRTNPLPIFFPLRHATPTSSRARRNICSKVIHPIPTPRSISRTGFHGATLREIEGDVNEPRLAAAEKVADASPDTRRRAA
jgi:hypothetical protein